jgi:hypothetical protein
MSEMTRSAVARHGDGDIFFALAGETGAYGIWHLDRHVLGNQRG